MPFERKRKKLYDRSYPIINTTPTPQRCYPKREEKITMYKNKNEDSLRTLVKKPGLSLNYSRTQT